MLGYLLYLSIKNYLLQPTPKGQDMIAKDYWAHIAPDGTEPWKFLKTLAINIDMQEKI